jgi:hypothetical protein
MHLKPWNHDNKSHLVCRDIEEIILLIGPKQSVRIFLQSLRPSFEPLSADVETHPILSDWSSAGDRHRSAQQCVAMAIQVVVADIIVDDIVVAVNGFAADVARKTVA